MKKYLTEPILTEEEPIYYGGQYPTIEVVAPRKYITRYNNSGNPIYTTNFLESMGYTPTSLNTREQLRSKFMRQQMSGLHGYADDVAKVAEVGIGGAMTLPFITGPIVADAVLNPIGTLGGLVGGIVGDAADRKINATKWTGLNLPEGTIGGLAGGLVGSYLGQVGSKIPAYLRLNKTYTGVPHKQIVVNGKPQYKKNGTPLYMDESFPRTHKKHTVWTSDDPDYAKVFTVAEDNGKRTYGTVFDVYTDPQQLSVLETPQVQDGQMIYWQGMPYRLKDGKVYYADNISTKGSNLPKSKEVAIKNRSPYGTYSADDLGSYIWKDREGDYIVYDWDLVPGAIKTDDIVKYSAANGFDATRFNKVYDGGVPLNDEGVFDFDLGNYYDYPINELVLNPGAPKYVLPHGTPKYKLINKMVDKNNYSSLPAALVPLASRNYHDQK